MTTIFTDGSSRGNPGPGGWAAIVASGEQVTELGGRVEHTTNNRMELQAVIEALEYAVRAGKNGMSEHSAEKNITLYTDSSYVKKGATQWLSGWQAGGWRTKAKKDILNRDLWEGMAAVLAQIERADMMLTWKLLGGHVGIPGNERCDEIATGFATGKTPELYTGPRAGYSVPFENISSDAFLKKEKSSSRAHSKAAAYSYVSMVNGKIMTHKTWAECEARVKGVKGTRFKKATSAEMEKDIIAEFSGR